MKKASFSFAVVATIALATPCSLAQSPDAAKDPGGATAAPSAAKCPPFLAIFSDSKEPYVLDSAKGEVTQLKDINPGASSRSSGGVVSGNALYFWAEDRDTGFRIWKTSGTTESTVPLALDYEAFRKEGGKTLYRLESGLLIASLKNISRYSADTGKLSNVFDPKLRFAEILDTGDGILARTQGTGFKKPVWVYEIPRTASKPIQIVESIAGLESVASAARVGKHWIRTNPGYTVASLEQTNSQSFLPLVKEISIKTSGAILGTKFLFGGQEDFKRPDGKVINKYGIELYETDGTAAGTKLLKDILDAPGDSVGSTPDGFGRCGNKVIFTIGERGEPNRNNLWESDGTSEGTKSLAVLPRGSSIENITPVGNGAAFTVSTMGRGKDLWWTDGTADGTRLIMEMGAAPGGLQVYQNGVVFYGVAVGQTGLWWSDGSPGPAQFVGTIQNPPYSLLRGEELFALLPGKP